MIYKNMFFPDYIVLLLAAILQPTTVLIPVHIGFHFTPITTCTRWPSMIWIYALILPSSSSFLHQDKAGIWIILYAGSKTEKYWTSNTGWRVQDYNCCIAFLFLANTSHETTNSHKSTPTQFPDMLKVKSSLKRILFPKTPLRTPKFKVDNIPS